LTGLTTPQRSVNNRELLETPKHDRTRQIQPDQTRPCVRSSSSSLPTTTSAYVMHDRTQALRVRSLLLLSVRSRTETAPLLLTLIGHAGPAKVCVRSPLVTSFRLLFFTELIDINSNFFSLANVPTAPSVHHLSVLAFHKHFKELITQFTVPLDPSNITNLDRSSGTR
jgi:hypothetical protein